MKLINKVISKTLPKANDKYEFTYTGEKAKLPKLDPLTIRITSDSIILPISKLTGVDLDLIIDWGDGTPEEDWTSDLPNHIYSSNGTYEIKVWGTIPKFNSIDVNTTERNKFNEITQYGQYQWYSIEHAFDGMTNLTNVPDTLWRIGNCTSMDSTFANTSITSVDFTYYISGNITSMYNCFYNCNDLTSVDFAGKYFDKVITWVGCFNGCPNIHSVDMSSIDMSITTNISYIFNGCSSLTTVTGIEQWDVNSVQFMNNTFANTPLIPDISNWDVSSLNNANVLFLSTTDIGTSLYDAILVKWSQIIPTYTGGSHKLGFGVTEYSQSAASAHDDIVNKGWNITDGGMAVPTDDPLELKISVPDNYDFEFMIDESTDPNAPDLDIIIDWGDGTPGERFTTYPQEHTYTTAGEYNVKIWGHIPTTRGTGNHADKILEIVHWGDYEFWDCNYMFRSCINLTSIPNEILNASNCKTFHRMFSSCYSLTSIDISLFQMDNAEDISQMFINCTSLTNIDFGNHTFSSVNDFYGLIEECRSITSIDISKFNMINATDIQRMFRYCDNLTTITGIEDINVSSVTNINYMFEGTPNVDPDISLWEVSSLEDADLLFSDDHVLSTSIYNNVLINWEPKLQSTTSGKLGFGESIYEDVADSARTIIINNGWTIKDGGMISLNPFEMEIYTDGDSCQLPLFNNGANTVDVMIDWGDGTPEEHITHETPSHAYSTGGAYTIKITGDIPYWRYYNIDQQYCDQVRKILSWGDFDWYEVAHGFRNCKYMTEMPSSGNWNCKGFRFYNVFQDCLNLLEADLRIVKMPDIVHVSYCFTGCYNLKKIYFFDKDNVGSSIERMLAMCYDCHDLEVFDATLFDTSQHTGLWEFAEVFKNCYNLVNITGIELMPTSTITTIYDIFFYTQDWSQDISQWDISNVDPANFRYIKNNNTNDFFTTEHYDNILNGWAPQIQTSTNGDIICFGSSKYSDAGATARQQIIDKGYNLYDGGHV
jgi:surface protein